MTISKPHRVKRSYTQRLLAPPREVFPLLCPVREVDWVDGWTPRAMFANSGLAELDCVFLTPDGEGEAIWVVTQYDPANCFIEFIKVTPGLTVGRIAIQLRPASSNTTEADVSYQYTALSEAGNTLVEDFTTEHYTAFMQTWERALNHYLQTGTKLVVKDEAAP